MSDKRYIRSPRDIEKSIKSAKLSFNELSGKTQTIFYSDNLNLKNNIKLLELDDNLLNELVSDKPLILKGEGAESVVLCTDKKTYDIKEAEVSNSLLLLPELEFFSNELDNSDDGAEECREIIRKSVLGTFNSYIEAKECAPHFQKLYKILIETRYKGPENEYQYEGSPLYSYEELLSVIQASQQEFNRALKSMRAFEIENKIRKLDFEYLFRVVSYMIDLIEENSWKLDEINEEETISSLSEIIPKVVLENVFKLFTEPSKVVNGIQLYQYNETYVCRMLAEALLRSSGKLVLTDFLEAWKDSVPEGMNAEEDMLHNLALIDRDSTPPAVSLLIEDDLPENVQERFRILFQKKTTWEKEKIIPFIERLANPKMDVNLMLTKYARGFTTDGKRYYVAKHGNA